MWMEKEADGPGPVVPSFSTAAAVAASCAATVLLGFFPGPLLDVARELYVSLI